MENSKVIILEFPFPDWRLSANGGQRVYPAKLRQLRRAYKSACYYLAISQLQKQVGVGKGKFAAMIGHDNTAKAGKIPMRVTFHEPDYPRRDDDNMAGAFKYGRDGMALALGIDDRHFMTDPVVGEARPPLGAVVVEIDVAGYLRRHTEDNQK